MGQILISISRVSFGYLVGAISIKVAWCATGHFYIKVAMVFSFSEKTKHMGTELKHILASGRIGLISVRMPLVFSSLELGNKIQIK